MSVYKMNNIQTVKFVQLYCEAECLWNAQTSAYKDRQARDFALEGISQEMGIKGFGPREVAQKIKNIRSAYNQEIKKIDCSKLSAVSAEGVYHPKVPWFDIIDGFLKRNSTKQEFSPDAHESNADISPIDAMQHPDYYYGHLDVGVMSLSEIRDLGIQLKSADTTEMQVSLKHRRTKKLNQGSQQQKNDKKRLPRRNCNGFNAWGRSLAKKLNSMEHSRALNLMIQIQSLISNDRITYESQKANNAAKVQLKTEPDLSYFDTYNQYKKLDRENCPSGKEKEEHSSRSPCTDADSAATSVSRGMEMEDVHGDDVSEKEEGMDTSDYDERDENLMYKKVKTKRTERSSAEDEDRHFVLSLVSDIRKIPEESKLDAKIDFMLTVKKWQA